MRRLFITGFGKFGRQAVDELRQENHLNQVVADFIDLAAGKSIGKDAVWIILGSLAEVSAMGEDSSIMHAFRFASAKGILRAVSLADGSQEKICKHMIGYQSWECICWFFSLRSDC